MIILKVSCHNIAFSIVSCLAYASAFAGSAPSSTEQQTEPGPSFWNSPTLTGDWGGIRKKLEDKGITFSANYAVDVLGNPLGGASQGVAYTGLLTWGTNIDFQKLVGWQGASFGSQWYWISGQDLSERHIQNLFTADNLAEFDTLRLGSLWFQQNLFSDKISLRAGILFLDCEFENSAVGALFINSAFGWSPFLGNNIPNGGPNCPMGAPGVRLALNPVDWFTYQGAITQGNVYPQNVNRHGFRWRLDNDNGYFFLQEAIFHLNPSGRYWGNYRFGSWIFNGETPSPSGTGTFRNNYGFYFMGDQMLLPTSTSDRNQGLAAFGHVAFDPPNSNVFPFYVDGGVTYTGPFSFRPNDSVGIAVAYGQLSDGTVDSAVKAFPDRSRGNGELVLEATYCIQIAGWMSLQPDFQYIVQPGGTGNISNACVVGMRAVVNF